MDEEVALWELSALMAASVVEDEGEEYSHTFTAEDWWYLQISINGYVVGPKDLRYEGLVAHRGILTAEESEWLDRDTVRVLASRLLDSNTVELEYVYGPGAPSARRLARRAQLDELLLQVQEAGGNMHQLALALNWYVEKTPTGDRCRKMTQALDRARSNRLLSQLES